MVNERGMDVNHTTIFRWVQRYGPELETRCRPHLRVVLQKLVEVRNLPRKGINYAATPKT